MSTIVELTTMLILVPGQARGLSVLGKSLTLILIALEGVRHWRSFNDRLDAGLLQLGHLDEVVFMINNRHIYEFRFIFSLSHLLKQQ